MDIAKAVAVAKGYTKPKEPKYEVIRFVPGVVFAQTESAGAFVDCPAVTWETACNAAQLLAMLKKAGDNPDVVLDRNTLVITGPSGVYRLQCLEPKARGKLPSAPEAPSRYVDLDEATFRSVAQVAALALATDADPTLSAVRLTPGWVAASRGNGLALAWLMDGTDPLCIVREPMCVEAKFFARLKGAVQISATKLYLWLKQGDVTRWARRLDVLWPDDAVSADNLARLRNGGDNRVAMAFETAPARVLFDRALAAADSPADAFRLTWGATLSLAGGGQRGRFVGEVPASVDGGGRVFGVAPAVWLRYLDALAVCCDAPVYMSMAGPTDPVALWGTSPRAVEVFVWPEYVPAG